MTKRLICIDIDGTLTANRERVSEKTKQYLTALVADGNSVVFVTGRTFSWSMHLLKTFDFDFILGCLNGAYIARMPNHTPLLMHAIDIKGFDAIAACTEAFDCVRIILCAPDKEEQSFLVEDSISSSFAVHLQARKRALKENWVQCSDCTNLPVDSFAAMRIFCSSADAKKLAKSIHEKTGFEAATMRDSFDSTFSVVQVTHQLATKGTALKEIAKYLCIDGVIIACGDDRNDIPMFMAADCSIVMNTASPDVLAHADIIAPSAEEDGLIVGLDIAFKKCADKA